MEFLMKIDNYEIYKLRKAGLTNQQILTLLEYDETVDQELLLGDIAEISGCRNPAVFCNLSKSNFWSNT